MINAGSAANRQKALNVYKQSRVETASPAELVLTLLNLCIRSMKKAANCIAEKDYVEANSKLLHAQDIVDELRGALNLEVGDLAENLHILYGFVHSSLVKANITKETGPLEDAMKAVVNLRDIWKEVIKSHG